MAYLQGSYMRMRPRSGLLSLAYLVGGAALSALAFPHGMAALLVVLPVWCLLFAAASFWLLRCPHCGKLAVITKDGGVGPVGQFCRSCGGTY